MARFKNFMNSVPKRRSPRNTFDLSYDYKCDSQFGLLHPIFVQDVLPSDTFKLQDEILVRFPAMIAPVLHNINVYVHYFFVPNRLLWSGFEEFITGGPDGTSTIVKPGVLLEGQAAADFAQNHTMLDLMGIAIHDTDAQDTLPIDILPFKAYQKIFNDYYRDQNLTDAIDFQVDQSGILDLEDSDDYALFDEITTLRYRAWEKDYFTSSLPWTQRGQQMSIPFNLNVPVSGTFDLVAYNMRTDKMATYQEIARGTTTGQVEPSLPIVDTDTLGMHAYPSFVDGSDFSDEFYGVISQIGSNNTNYFSWLDSQGDTGLNNNWYAAPATDAQRPLAARGTTVGAPTINDLRTAMRIQQWMETNAVGGSRYIEQIYAHFGVKSSDARLQRAEYLGGGKIPVVVSEVEQTSATNSTSPQGHLAGQAIGTGKTIKFKRFFEEHGWIIGIMSIMPRASYGSGVPRKFLHQTRYDYYWPEFAHLGEQPIYNQELFFGAASGVRPDGAFGYTPRYAEYRFNPSIVAGNFRTSKSYWHLARLFDSQPGLNESFVYLNSSTNLAMNRIFAAPQYGWPFDVEVFHKCYAKRPIPKFAIPTL